MPNEGPVPVEVVRDLLGIARAMYAAFESMGPEYSDQKFKLRGIGYQLQLALERAGEGGPGTFKNRCAWLIASQAAKDLGALVDAGVPEEVVVRAAGERLAKRNLP